MAIIGQLTLDQVAILEVDSDPSLGGAPSAIGSIATLYDGTNARMWVKSAAADTGWTLLPRATSATPLQSGGFVFGDANGNLQTNSARAFWDGAGRFAFGTNAPAVPQSTLHLDRGTAVGSHVRFTAGTTTGQTSGDGTEFGIDDTGAAEIRQYENSNINFYTNNTVRGSFTNDGKFLLGATTGIDITGAAAIPQFQIIGTAAVQMAGIQYSADTIGPVFNLLKSRGATIATQGLVQSGDEFGRIQFRASDGTNFQAGASIRALVDGTAAANSMPGYMILMTTPTGATTPVERMRIDSTGQTIFGANIRVGDGADTTNANIVYRSNEFLGRENGSWRNLTFAPSFNVTATAAQTTTSGTYAVITGTQTTPAAGTYLAIFSGHVTYTGNGQVDVALHIAGNVVNETTRSSNATASFGTINGDGNATFITTITVNGSQTVDVRIRRISAGTSGVDTRQFILIPIAR